MNQMRMQILALVLLLIPLPTISIGTTQEIPVLWWIGLALLAIGGLIPAVLHFVPVGEGDDEEEQQEEKGRNDE